MVDFNDLKVYRSTSDLGGAITATEITSGNHNNLFRNVTYNELVTGEDFYKCVFIKNTNQSETMAAFKWWLSSKSFPHDTQLKWGYDPDTLTSGPITTVQTVPDVYTAPSGVTWRDVETQNTAFTYGDIPSGKTVPIWLWLHVNANALARLDDNAIFTSNLTIPGGGTGSGGGTGGATEDQFGIKQFFQTKPGGLEWFSNRWDNGHTRTLSIDEFDPDDPRFGVTGHSSMVFTINGDGTATMPTTMGPTNTQRLFVHGPWTNTEITIYVRWRTTRYDSVQLRSRSNHHGVQNLPYGLDTTNEISCGFGCYNTKWSEAGSTTVSNEVEVIHDLYARGLDPHTYTLQAINTWMGLKQITRTIGNTVNVQGWINYDITDQTAWTKSTEFTYDGTNVHVDPTGHELNVTQCLNQGDMISGALDANTLWLNESYWSWVRFNAGDDIDVKFFSVREIEPQAGTGGGGGTGGNPPPTTANYKIAVLGDEGCETATNDAISLIQNNAYDYVVSVGDHAYEAASCWTSRFSPLKSKMTSAYGNHEYSETGGTTPYKTFFGDSKTYFTKQFQNILFIIIDTNLNVDPGSTQHTFVEQALATAATDPSITWKIAVMHHPWFGNGATHPADEFHQVEAFHQLFTTNHVSLVLTGHNHNWQRSKQVSYNSSTPKTPTVVSGTSPFSRTANGLIAVVSGAGGHDSGSGLYSLPDGGTWQAYSNRTHNGIWEMVATNNGNTLTCSFVANDGTKFDTFVYNA